MAPLGHGGRHFGGIIRASAIRFIEEFEFTSMRTERDAERLKQALLRARSAPRPLRMAIAVAAVLNALLGEAFVAVILVTGGAVAMGVVAQAVLVHFGRTNLERPLIGFLTICAFAILYGMSRKELPPRSGTVPAVETEFEPIAPVPEIPTEPKLPWYKTRAGWISAFRELPAIAVGATIFVAVFGSINVVLPHHQWAVWTGGWGPFWLFWPISGCMDLVSNGKSMAPAKKKWVLWSFAVLVVVIAGLWAFSDRPHPWETFAAVAGAFLALLRPDLDFSRPSALRQFLSRWLLTYCFLIFLSNIFLDSDLSLLIWMGIAKAFGSSSASAPEAAPPVSHAAPRLS